MVAFPASFQSGETIKLTTNKQSVFIVTPIEVISYILHSTAVRIAKEFGATFATKGVSILDPFAGDGRFLAVLIASPSLVPDSDLDVVYDKCETYELEPELARLAKRNIEAAYTERCGRTREFLGCYNVDTFTINAPPNERMVGDFPDWKPLEDYRI